MMRWFSEVRVAVRSLFARRAFDDQLDADLRFHLEQATAEYVRDGLSPDAARHAALRAFGNPTQVMEEVREAAVWTWWERAMQDVRYGVRTFRRNPAFAGTAVLSLALGIGANAAIFTLTNAALITRLPVSHPEQLAILDPKGDDRYSYPDYLALRDGSRAFSDVMAVSSLSRLGVVVGAEADHALVKMVTGNYFVGLGVPARIGRVFAREDELQPVAVISRGYWSRRFSESTGALRQPIVLNGMTFTVVGVAPAEFSGEAAGESPDIWATLALQTPERRAASSISWLRLIGRLQPETSREQAEGEVNGVLTRARAAGAEGAVQRIEVSPGARGLSGLRDTFSAPLRVLTAIAGLVLLIACTNLAGLLLARAAAREGEIAVRLAIGAGRGRIIRQLMTESLVLAAAGGALGLAVAAWGSGALLQLASRAGRPLVLDLRPDWRVVLFTAGVSVAAAVLFGLAPALRAVRSASVSARAERAFRAVGPDGRWSMRDMFIVVQLALSLTLLAVNAMFIRTLSNLQNQDLGFRADDVLVIEIARARGYQPELSTLVPRLLERIQAIPGVAAASAAFGGTLAIAGGVNGLQVDGYTPQGPQDQRARADWVGPNYFWTAGIPLVAGRDFALTDSARARKVAVINQTMARFYFGDGAGLGRRFTFNKNEYDIVGVAQDAKYASLRETTPRTVYFAMLQGGGGLNGIELRTPGGDPSTVAGAVRAAIREVDPRLSAGAVSPLSARVDRNLVREHVVADLAGFFGGLTLLLVSIGVYGTLAYTAARRRKEIGIRLALGSPRAGVIWLVLRAVVALLGVGLLLGLGGALAAGRLVASMLFGVRPTDAATIALAATMLIVVALAAGFLPASRASRLDPVAVLRE